MIGTTVKLGMDASAVKTGLGGLGHLFGRFGKQISIGGARQIGAQMTDWVGKLLMVLPEAISETMDWAGELVDLSKQTGMTTKDLMELSEAFRLAGGEGMDAGRMIGTMRKNLYEASSETEGDKVDALRLLGLRDSDIQSLGPMQQFEKIMKALNATMGSMDPGQLEKTTIALFGQKMGLKGIAIFKDFNAGLGKAKENLGSMANMSPELLAAIDDLGDSIGRFSMVKKGLTVRLMEGILGTSGLIGATGMVDAFYNKMLALGDSFRDLGESLRKAFDSFMAIANKDGFGAAFGDLLKKVGYYLGEGIKEGMSSMGVFGTIKNAIQKGREIRSGETNRMDQFLPGMKPVNDAARTIDKAIFGELSDQTSMLERIYREKGGMWA